MRKIIAAAVYLLIGLGFWLVGYVNAPTLGENIATFFYVVILWPVIIIGKFIHNLSLIN